MVEKAYPRPAVNDKSGEYSYLFTECGNVWYSTTKDPMYRNGCICPKCKRIVEIVMPNRE